MQLIIQGIIIQSASCGGSCPLIARLVELCRKSQPLIAAPTIVVFGARPPALDGYACALPSLAFAREGAQQACSTAPHLIPYAAVALLARLPTATHAFAIRYCPHSRPPRDDATVDAGGHGDAHGHRLRPCGVLGAVANGGDAPAACRHHLPPAHVVQHPRTACARELFGWRPVRCIVGDAREVCIPRMH